MKTLVMILGSFLLLHISQAQDTESKAPKIKSAVEKISVDKLLVELGADDAITRRDAFKKATILPKEKILELYKKLMASDDPEFNHVAEKLALFIRDLLFNEDVALIPRITEAKFAPLKGLAKGSKAAQDSQREAAKKLPLEMKIKKSGIVFRLIPAGKFSMGSPKAQKQAEVTKPFYIGKFEVTQEQWQKVMGNTLADQNDRSQYKGIYGAGDNFPMYHVSWDDCQDFIKKLSALEGLTNNLKLSLPTEIAWEYACRAGTQTAYYTGAAEADLARAGWYGYDNKGNSNKTTHEVGQKLCNAFGLYDIHGNVWEWCNDWYSGDRSNRVNRGGNWSGSALLCRSAFRNRYSPGLRGYFLGLRLALSQSVKK